MSAHQWKPGDVAMVGSTVALRTTKGWTYSSDGSVGGLHQDAYERRPLVVINPEDREQVERIEAALAKQHGWPVPHNEPRVGYMQAALRSLITPPKPDEPQGLGAVVEDAEGERWVRSHTQFDACWTRPHLIGTYLFAEIDAVRVLSEGVTS